MPCFRPVTAWQPLDGGALHFSEKKACREISIPCGQCTGCRIRRREAWAIRCLCESKCHERNSFVTLTYSDDALPMHGSLIYSHFQKFMHRLRKKVGPVRFFMCGEYGDSFDRPHYHALLFGLDFADKQLANSVRSRSAVYRSPTLERLWPHGFSSIGEVSYESARYCAAYAVKRVTGALADSHYERVDASTGELVQLVPEFAHMSLKPGIGAEWLRRYWPDVYVSGHMAIIVNGKRKPVPRYFDQRMDSLVPLLMDAVEYERYLKADAMRPDSTRERLAVRETVEVARIAFNKERSERPCVTRLLP